MTPLKPGLIGDALTPSMAWALGIFEGEGWITIPTASSHTAALWVSMTDQDVIHRLRLVTGVGIIHGPVKKGLRKDGTPCKPQWRWNVNRRGDVRWLMKRWYPYLSSRRAEQVDQALGLYWAAQSEMFA